MGRGFSYSEDLTPLLVPKNLVNDSLTIEFLNCLRFQFGEKVVQARKLETRPVREMPIQTAQVWISEPIWPRGSRIAFVLAAAMACWAVPLLLAYLLTR